MHTDPHKPSSLPAAAFWEPKDNEWVVAERNAAGEFHGLVTYYRPDGTRCCATEHRNGTPHGAFTRYHENQEPSRTGRFVEGVLHGTNVFLRSTAKTTENFPAGLGKNIWRCEMDFVHGRTTDGRLFDREGRRVMEDGTPFPTQRPAGVSATAHFKKGDDDEYAWVEGSTAEVDGDWVKVGMWRWWTPDGQLVREERYNNDGLRLYDRPAGVPAEAWIDEDDEVWLLESSGDGDTKRWDLDGVLRHVETRERGELVRIREFLSDGSLAQDSVLFDDGVPRSKYFRRTPDEELESFPNVKQADALEVHYSFDEHGMMSSFRILGEAGAILEEQHLYRNARNDTDQMKFPSIEAAAAAWTTEGDRYTTELNRWLAEMYASENGEVSCKLDERRARSNGEAVAQVDEEPTFDRHDLERPIIEAIAQLNAAGKLGRELFPLYHDGIGAAFWDRFGLVVDAVLDAGNGSTLVRVKHPSRPAIVMRITPHAVVPVPELLAFGASHDKRTTAYAYEDRIELHRGTESVAIAYPTNYQHAGADAIAKLGTGTAVGVRALRVAESGREVVLVATAGIFVLSQGRQQRLYPLDATLDEYVSAHDPDAGPLEIAMHFANADIAPAGDRITCGGLFRRGMMAGLAMYKREDHRWFLENTSQDDAFFPAQAVFHATKPCLAYAACLYASLSNRLTNTTFRIDLEGLAAGAIENFDGGIAQEPGRVQAIASFGDGFLLGFDNGYVRWMGTSENLELLGYVFVGGSVLALDVSPDQKSFTVATDAGVVSRFSLADKPARNLIASIPLSDDARTCFFRTFAPLRW